MPVRSSQAHWEGSLARGTGTMALGSGAWSGAYSAASRFESAEGTNPEELIGAAHAGCFSLALSGQLTRNGTPPESIDTTASVHIDKVGEAWEITKIELRTEVRAADVDDAKFQELAAAAKAGCPVSKALAAVSEIVLDARLVG